MNTISTPLPALRRGEIRRSPSLRCRSKHLRLVELRQLWIYLCGAPSRPWREDRRALSRCRMTSATLLAVVCVVLTVAAVVLIRKHATPDPDDPRNHRSDFALWDLDRPRESKHE